LLLSAVNLVAFYNFFAKAERLIGLPLESAEGRALASATRTFSP